MKQPQPRIKLALDTIVAGDCLKGLRTSPADSIDLVMTSPPYPDRRTANYSGTTADKYVEWFLPIAAEIMRVLKPTGSSSSTSTKVARMVSADTSSWNLVQALRAQGWR